MPASFERDFFVIIHDVARLMRARFDPTGAGRGA